MKFLRKFLDWCFEPILIELRGIHRELTAIRQLEQERDERVRTAKISKGGIPDLQSLKALGRLGDGALMSTSQDA